MTRREKEIVRSDHGSSIRRDGGGEEGANGGQWGPLLHTWLPLRSSIRICKAWDRKFGVS
jgi:hypothetical protein